MMRDLLKAVAGMLFAGFMSVGQASVIGATANVDFYFPDTSSLFCSSGSAVIGGGVEYPAGCGGFSPVSIDIGDGTVVVGHSNSAFASGSFNGFVLDITGFDITSIAYTGGSLGVTGVFIVGGDAWFNFASQGSGLADFVFESRQTGTQVPEPATLLLVGLGLCAAGLRRRKQG